MTGRTPWLQSFWREPQKTRLRYWTFQIHLWAGVGVGLYILAISLSGSALVFREELETGFLTGPRRVEAAGRRASLEQVRQLAAAEFPGYKVAWIRDPAEQDLAHDVWVEKGEDARLAWVNPYGPALVEEVGATTSVWTFLQDLHFYLFAGRVGLLVNGAGGLLLGALCLTGLILWWPGPRKWRRALKLRSGKGWKRLNWDLHNAGGFWTFAFVAMWSLTGAYFAFPQPFVAAVQAVLPLSAPPPKVAEPVEGRPMAPVDALVQKALDAAPGMRPDWIGLPHHDDERLATIYLVPRDERDGHESTYVHMDPYRAEVLRIDRPEDRTAGDRALALFASLHFGTFGGWPVKVLWAVLGLTPGLLFVTGFLMWWNRVLSKRWRRWRRRARGGAEEASGRIGAVEWTARNEEV